MTLILPSANALMSPGGLLNKKNLSEVKHVSLFFEYFLFT